MSGSGQHAPSAIVLDVLNAWKPSAWGSSVADGIDIGGAAAAVSCQLHTIESVNDAAAVIAAAFTAAFPGRAEQFTRYTCTSAGAKLYHELRSKQLLTSRMA